MYILLDNISKYVMHVCTAHCAGYTYYNYIFAIVCQLDRLLQ